MGRIAGQLAAMRGDDFPAAVIALITLTLVVVSGWAVLVGLLASVPGLRGFAVALTPRLLRGVVFAGVAGALTVPGAHADDRGIDGLQVPDRPLVAEASPAAEVGRTVVVRPGDSLWTITRAHMGSGDSPATIARESERWHEANRDVIGDDPDLIHPGQRLSAPSEDRS